MRRSLVRFWLALGATLLLLTSNLATAAPTTQSLPLSQVGPPYPAARGVVDERATRAPGEVVIRFRPSVRADRIDALRAELGLAVLGTIPRIGVSLLRTAPGTELELVRRLQNDARVEFAEPNYLVHALGTGCVSIPGFFKCQTPTPALPPSGCVPIPGFFYCSSPTPAATSGCVSIPGHFTCPTPVPPPVPQDPLYASSQLDLPLIGMPTAWARTVGSPSVTTAVIDTGAAFGHPDLNGRLVSLTGPGLPGSDHVFIRVPSAGCAIPQSPDDDAWGAPGRFTHGTHVTGTIVARSTLAGDPPEGVAGVAPRTRVAPLKVLDCAGNGTAFDVASAITFAAAHGAQIINMSLGSDGNASFCPFIYQSAINAAYAAGATTFVAAGNDGTSNRSLPAACEHVVGVGATTNSDVKASFSQFNDTVDVVAPGVGIMSTFRDNAGEFVYRTLNGTSMATPHVAGCAALMLSLRPGLLPDQIEAILRGSALDLGAKGRDDLYGSGRLNCGAAVQLAAQTVPGTPVPLTSTPTPAPGNCGSYPGLAGWTPILCETFEGPWPTGLWSTFDGNGASGGVVCWGTDDFQAYRSPMSAWPGKGCTDGADPTDFLYGPGWDSSMVAGPFSLAGSSAAEARFRLWYQIAGQLVNGQVDGDFVTWGASIDGVNFFGPTVTGSSTNDQPPTPQGWIDLTFDLTTVPSLGSLLGQPRVWMAWRFVSDSSGLDDGPFVDDVLIRAR